MGPDRKPGPCLQARTADQSLARVGWNGRVPVTLGLSVPEDLPVGQGRHGEKEGTASEHGVHPGMSTLEAFI